MPPRSARTSSPFSLTPGAPHRVQNALAALAASIRAADLDARDARDHSSTGVGIMTGRGVEQAVGGVTLIDDSFNGNPASDGRCPENALPGASVRAAAALRCSATCWNWAMTHQLPRGSRRI